MITFLPISILLCHAHRGLKGLSFAYRWREKTTRVIQVDGTFSSRLSPSPQAWSTCEPCSSAPQTFPQRSAACQAEQASYQLACSVDKSPPACRYREGWIRTFPFSCLPSGSERHIAFCLEGEAAPVQLWNMKEKRRKASRAGGRKNEKEMRDEEDLLHHLICPGTELSDLQRCCEISFKLLKSQGIVTFSGKFILQHCLVYCEGLLAFKHRRLPCLARLCLLLHRERVGWRAESWSLLFLGGRGWFLQHRKQKESSRSSEHVAVSMADCSSVSHCCLAQRFP